MVVNFYQANGWHTRIIVQLPAIYQRLVVTKVFVAVRKALPHESIESVLTQSILNYGEKFLCLTECHETPTLFH